MKTKKGLIIKDKSGDLLDIAWPLDGGGFDLSGSDLRDSNLRGSNLSSSNLSSSNLSFSDLRDSNLRGSNLSFSDLRDSNLRGSDLRGSELSPIKSGFDPQVSLGVTVDKSLPARIAEQVLKDGQLAMNMWYVCKTTHCLAHWAVHLSGAAGYALEAITSPSVAGAILAPSIAHLFYSSNEEALQWAKTYLKA